MNAPSSRARLQVMRSLGEAALRWATLGLAGSLLIPLVLAPLPAFAAAAPQRVAPLPPVEGEVIVRFKAEAPTLRQHALANDAREGPAAVATALAGRAAALGARMGRTLEAGAPVGERMQVVRERGADAAELARRLAADPEVEFAVPNGRQRRLQAAIPPNDPLYPVLAGRSGGPDAGQWYLRRPDSTLKSAIDIEPAWARGFGSASVVVAVLDTGVRFEHPDLGRVATGGRLLPGYDFVSDAAVANDADGRDADPSDPGDWISATEANRGTFPGCDASPSSWHGTTTASLVAGAANNGVGMAGTAPGINVLPVRVLGKCFGTDGDIQAAMRWAAGISVAGVPDNPNPAKVINLSLGGQGSCNAAYQTVVNEVVARGVIIVAAAGNSAGEPVGEPANCSGVVAVAALRHAGTKVGFSDLGPQISIAAPGGNCVNVNANEPCLYPIVAATNSGSTSPVNSAWTNGSTDVSVGTSFSSPIVAGVFGLMISAGPTVPPATLKAALRATSRQFPQTGADNGPGDPTAVAACHTPAAGVQQLQCYCSTALCGAGMLDAGKAVSSLFEGVAARIDEVTATPTEGAAVTLDSSASVAVVDASIVGRSWSIVDGGGIVTRFDGGTSGTTAQFTPSAAGTVVVRLTVTGSAGGQGFTDHTVTVAAAAPTGTGGSGSGGSSSGGSGGGGAVSWPWAALLGLAALSRARRVTRRP